ncbi:hypothetical protein ACX9NE_03160 [Mycobacterium sp. ML4]
MAPVELAIRPAMIQPGAELLKQLVATIPGTAGRGSTAGRGI